MLKKMTPTQYPPRLWSLAGHADSGKTTFATAMRCPLLLIDADHRFTEALALVRGDVYQLSDRPADLVNADTIARLLAEHMPGATVGTIVIDSLTAIISPLVAQAMIDKEAGRAANLAAAFKTKALAMRVLQDGVTRWGTDVLWIWHLQDARDEKAREVVRATIPPTERARLLRSLNLALEIVRDGQRRGVKVAWARRGRAGMTLWDDTGAWLGMPEALEHAVYDGLTLTDQDRIEHAAPAVFGDPSEAWAWGFSAGAFEALQHSRNTYEKIKREQQPRTAAEMRALWVSEVEARLAERMGTGQ